MCKRDRGARCVLQATLRLYKNKPDTLNRLQLWMVKLNDRVESPRIPWRPVGLSQATMAA